MSQDSADDLALQATVAIGTIASEVEVSRSGWAPTGPEPARMMNVDPAWAETTFTRGGVTFVLRRLFYDADDQPLEGYGPTAVKLVAMSRAYGTFTGERDTAQVGHSASLEVRGIGQFSDTLRFNGGSRDTLSHRFRALDGTQRYFFWNSGSTLSEVRFLRDNSNPFPLSGQLVYVVHAERQRTSERGTVEASYDATVTIVFNGTAVPDIVVNGTWHYHWNMLTGELTRA